MPALRFVAFLAALTVTKHATAVAEISDWENIKDLGAYADKASMGY